MNNSTCTKSDQCWRYSYSKFFEDNQNSEKIPTRGELFFLGYATEKQSTCKEKNGKKFYGGIFCKNFPDASGNNFCPAMLGGSCYNCEEYNLDEEKRSKYTSLREENKKRFKTKYGRAHIPQDVRKKVAAKYKYTCVYCARHLTKIKRCGAKGVVDHFISLRSGGEDNESNFVFACSNCNNAKQDAKWEFGCRIGHYEAQL